MSDNNNSNRDVPEESDRTPPTPMAVNASSDLVSEAWSTQGHVLGVGHSPPPTVAVLPRRTAEGSEQPTICEYHLEVLQFREQVRNQVMRLANRDENGDEDIDIENADEDGDEDADADEDGGDLALDEELEQPSSNLIIGRDHPDSSDAALAGYRYRVRE